MSNILVISNNYESETIFLMMGYMYMNSAIVFNLGYEWHQAWIYNFIFVWPVCAFMFMQFWITLVPGKLSCLWHVSCKNKDVMQGVMAFEKVPIQNPFNTTVMPQEYDNKLIALMVCNMVTVVAWDYFIVNGIVRNWLQRSRKLRRWAMLLLSWCSMKTWWQ